MKKDLIQTVKIIVIALVLTLGVNYVFAWTGSTIVAPEGNTSGPINIGATTQIKDAGLGLDTLSVFGSGYIQDALGIGDITPDNGLILDVNGQMGAAEYCDENGLNCIEIADLYNYTPETPTLSDCTLDGQTVTSGNSGTFYQTQTVPDGSTCISEQRLCTDGTFTTGSYQYSSCTVDVATPLGSCTQDGVTVVNGNSRVFYARENAWICILWDQIRTCNNGSLNGSDIYQYANCN